ncbi:MAG: hypothetical protein OSB47_13510 [Pirellulaceae bacterium]|jgi:hypothetical protein|nr:hypothetical protein [Pirellulaceae bacterium]
MWTITGQQAHLQTLDLSGTIDLSTPGTGLHQLCLADRPLVDLQLLGIARDGCTLEAVPLQDPYARDNSLIIRYGDREDPSHHLQLQWRCIPPEPGLFMGGLELILSFETPSQVNLPDWTTVTQAGQQDILAASNDSEQPWISLNELSEARESTLSPSGNGTRMILCRFPKQKLSYVEMTHPAEPSLAILPTTETTRTLWGSRTPDRPLEKGVILRRRVRGVFLPLEKDTVLADKAYAQFRALAPPLN